MEALLFLASASSVCTVRWGWRHFPGDFSSWLCPLCPKGGTWGRTAKGRPCLSTSDFSHTLVSIFWWIHLMLELVRSKNPSWSSYSLKYYLTETTLPVWIPSLSAQTYENERSHLSCHFSSSPGVLSHKQTTITGKGTKPSMLLDFPQVHPFTCCPSFSVGLALPHGFSFELLFFLPVVESPFMHVTFNLCM